MIQRHRPSTLRRCIGFIGLAALMAGGAFMAQASVHTQANQPATQELSFNSRIQPHYPEDAIKNKQEGMVVLMVLVGTDGTARNVRVDPATHAAPSLIKAASDAAAQWHFNPAIRNGKPIVGYARVPVKFSLSPLPPTAPAAPATPISSKY